jgi:hypothetical protein
MTLAKNADRKTLSQIRNYRRAFPFVSASICLLLTAIGASGQNTLSVTKPSGFAVSPRVTDIGDFEGQNPPTKRPHRPLPDRDNRNNQNGDDDARQNNPEPTVKAFRHAHFGGVGANGYAPPDTNIAVGPNHIVETVNVRFAIYDKNGALLVGPKSLSSLWTALGAPCATSNGGDPVVQYDKVADRWLITQLGSTSGPYSECIAVSLTSDPAGAYYLYSYSYNLTLNDYPKFGVWPTAHNSAYLATYNLFPNGTLFAGGQLCAYDRSAMLSGAAAPSSICYTIPNDGGYLPSDLDGSTAPLDGTPGYFMNFETLSSLRIYTLAPNFANPSASVLSLAPDLPVLPFTEACNGGTCIPQAGTTQQLDSLGDRLMYRLAFRMFADHEAMVVNHSVGTGSTVGVRWYELRVAPLSSTGNFSVFQQGTFSPADGTYRWMGSAAMDQAGDIAVGYSASSSSIHPAIRYTGRAPGDPAGTMGTEASLLEGSGSQISGLSRWGDYTSMRIDPRDDCTFWYANEYLPADGSYNWSTFIGSFKFPGCGAGPDFSISASPASQTVLQTASTSYTVTVTPSGGFNDTITLSASGLPAGATATFNPPTIASSGSSTMTVTTSSTPVGSYTITITGTSPTVTHSTAVTLVVNPAGDFSISATPPSQSVTAGNSVTYSVTVTPSNGFNSTVTFSVSGLPAGASASFNPQSVAGSGSSTMTVTTSAATPAGSYTLTITGSGGNRTHSTTVTLLVNASPFPDFSITASPSSRTIFRGSRTTYTVTVHAVNGFAGTVNFRVSGLPSRTSASFNPSSVTGSGSSTMTVSTSRRTPTGSFSLTITGTSGSLVHSAKVTLVMQ